MIILSQAQVEERLTFKLVFTAVERALVAAADGSGTLNPVVMGHGLNEGECFSIKSGTSADDRVIGLKVGSYWPANARLGIAPHGSTILLLDPETGRMMAVIEASRLNGARTAAADAVAAHVLARPSSHTLTVIGAGHQSEHEVRALCQILPIQRLLIVGRSASRANALAERLGAELGITASATDVEHGCREADVLVTVTPSCAPLFESLWLKPGVHIATMGSDQLGKQELPPDLLHRARLFCDLPAQSIAIGEFQHVKNEIASGDLRLTAVGEVLNGRAPGRLDPEEITIFDSSGLALQDLFVATSLLRAGA